MFHQIIRLVVPRGVPDFNFDTIRLSRVDDDLVVFYLRNGKGSKAHVEGCFSVESLRVKQEKKEVEEEKSEKKSDPNKKERKREKKAEKKKAARLERKVCKMKAAAQDVKPYEEEHAELLGNQELFEAKIRALFSNHSEELDRMKSEKKTFSQGRAEELLRNVKKLDGEAEALHEKQIEQETESGELQRRFDERKLAIIDGRNSSSSEKVSLLMISWNIFLCLPYFQP